MCWILLSMYIANINKHYLCIICLQCLANIVKHYLCIICLQCCHSSFMWCGLALYFDTQWTLILRFWGLMLHTLEKIFFYDHTYLWTLLCTCSCNQLPYSIVYLQNQWWFLNFCPTDQNLLFSWRKLEGGLSCT